MTETIAPRTFARSNEFSGRAKRLLPGGVNSNVRLSAPSRFFAAARGAWLWDVDGNDYVDYLLGQGPAFLGHAHSRVNDAVAAACAQGMVFGAQHELEIEAAELVCETLRWPEMVRFGVSGTEVVQAAVRLARAHTGRQKIVRFEDQYHGWLDNVMVGRDGRDNAVAATAGQDPSAFRELIVLPWNDVEAIQDAFERYGSQIAAVITEPMMCNAGAILPVDGFLQELRRVCDVNDSVLIFDEVISGFRVGAGGAVELFDVVPDLATYGKALAGGWPVAAVAGRADLMDRFGTGEVTHAGTFNGSTMACAAVIATLQFLRDDPPYVRIAEHGDALMKGLIGLAEQHGLPLHLQGLPCAFHATLSEQDAPFSRPQELKLTDQAGYARIASVLADYGVWVAGRGIWYVSAAHGARELEAALSRVDAAFASIQA